MAVNDHWGYGKGDMVNGIKVTGVYNNDGSRYWGITVMGIHGNGGSRSMGV